MIMTYLSAHLLTFSNVEIIDFEEGNCTSLIKKHGGVTSHGEYKIELRKMKGCRIRYKKKKTIIQKVV